MGRGAREAGLEESGVGAGLSLRHPSKMLSEPGIYPLRSPGTVSRQLPGEPFITFLILGPSVTLGSRGEDALHCIGTARDFCKVCTDKAPLTLSISQGGTGHRWHLQT